MTSMSDREKEDRQKEDGTVTSPRGGYSQGLRIGVGLAAASFVLAITFGALTRSQGWGIVAPIICSLVVFSGSAQFALATALSGGGSVGPAIVAAGLINGRYLPMGLAVAPSLRGNRFRRAVEGQAVVDGSWAAAHLGDGRFDRELLIGSTLIQWPAWVLGTAVGVFVAPAPDVVDKFGLDLAFPAFFLVLLLDEVRSARKGWAAAGIGATAAAALVAVLPAGLALIGATVGSLIGLGDRAPGRSRAGDAPGGTEDA
jgi:4-azaleucine resistance transporter AzlC